MYRFNAVFCFFLPLLISCGSGDKPAAQSADNDARMIDVARQAVIDANEVTYNFAERKPVLDKSDPELVRIAFVYTENNKPGGDPIVYLSSETGELIRIEYTR